MTAETAEGPVVEEAIISFEAVAYHRVGSDLGGRFRHLRRRFWRRAILLTLVAALSCCLAPLAYSIVIHGQATAGWRFESGMAAIAAAAGVIMVAGLLPVLYQGERYLSKTASIISRANIELLALLGKVTELRGGDTAGHTLRVTVYTMLFAEHLRLPRETLFRAVEGALLHDIGKLVIPDQVILKPGALTREERALMQTHVTHGLEIIAQSEWLRPAVNVVGSHHERYDGRGYPCGAEGDEIPFEARLFALVDVFDALTQARAYKPALPLKEALAVMVPERGTHFDPYLFDRFAELAPDFERTVPREESGLKAMLLQKLTPYLEASEIGHLRGRLLAVEKSRSSTTALRHP